MARIGKLRIATSKPKLHAKNPYQSIQYWWVCKEITYWKLLLKSKIFKIEIYYRYLDRIVSVLHGK